MNDWSYKQEFNERIEDLFVIFDTPANVRAGSDAKIICKNLTFFLFQFSQPHDDAYREFRKTTLKKWVDDESETKKNGRKCGKSANLQSSEKVASQL